MQSHRLQLNTSKTIWCCPTRRRWHIPDGDFHVEADQVKPVSAVRKLGVFVDDEISMRSHISRVSMQSARSVYRKIATIRCAGDAVTTLVYSRLSYCNVVFAGLPACDIQRLQSVLNLSVRLVAGARKYDHVTSLLRDQHWVPITERIEYKLCTLVNRCLHGNASRYFAEYVTLTSFVGRRSGLLSAHTLTLEVPKTRVLFGDRAFSVAGPRAWNSLPIKVRFAQSMFSFRKFLKHFIPACVFLT